MNKFKELKPFDEKSGAIGQDIILDVPDRVAKNSVRLREVENAVKQAEKIKQPLGKEVVKEVFVNLEL